MNKRGRTLIITGLLLIAAALLLAGYNLWSASNAQRQSSEIVSELSDTTVKAADTQYPDYVLDPEMEMPTVEIDGREYIGTLSIPALGLELPVAADWSYPALRSVPCRYKGSAYLDDLIICAHNYDSHFGRLKALHPGDKVIFTDAAGNVFDYEVSVLETLPPTAREDMEQGGDLTLFTCTIGGRSRVTLRCEETDNQQ